jgi:hypothetical protein
MMNSVHYDERRSLRQSSIKNGQGSMPMNTEGRAVANHECPQKVPETRLVIETRLTHSKSFSVISWSSGPLGILLKTSVPSAS